MEITSIFEPITTQAAAEGAGAGADSAAAQGQNSFAALLDECSGISECASGAGTAAAQGSVSEGSAPIAPIPALLASVTAKDLLNVAEGDVADAMVTGETEAVQAAPLQVGVAAVVTEQLPVVAAAPQAGEVGSGSDDVEDGGKTDVNGLMASNASAEDKRVDEAASIITLEVSSAAPEAAVEEAKAGVAAGASMTAPKEIERVDGAEADEAVEDQVDDEAAEEARAPVAVATPYAPFIAASAYAQTAGTGTVNGKGEGAVGPFAGIYVAEPGSGPSLPGGAAKGPGAGGPSGASAQAVINGDGASDEGYDYSAIKGTFDGPVEMTTAVDAPAPTTAAPVESSEAAATLPTAPASGADGGPSAAVAGASGAKTTTNPGAVKPAKGVDPRPGAEEKRGAERFGQEAASVEGVDAHEQAATPAVAVFDDDDAVIKSAAKGTGAGNGAGASKEAGFGAIAAGTGADNEDISRPDGVPAHKEAGKDAVFSVNPDAAGAVMTVSEEGREPEAASTGAADTVKGANGVTLPAQQANAADRGADVAVAAAPQAKAAAGSEPAPVFEVLEDGLKVSVLKGGKEVTVTLHPEELGRLKVSVAETRDVVSAKIIVENAAVKEMLDAGSYRLKELFARHGLNLDRCSVEVGGFASSSSGNGTADGAAGGKGAWQHSGAGFGPAGEGAGRERGRGHYARPAGNNGVPAGALGGLRADRAAGGLDVFA